MKPAKSQIRRAFDKAAETYDREASLQRLAAERLTDRLPTGLRPRRVLDAGCGTGFGLRLLGARYPQAELVGLDIAPSMLRLAGQGGLVAGDLENLPFGNGDFDLYWSSLAIQWCDCERVLREAARVLRPGAGLAIATLGPSTFEELRIAFSAGDTYSHTIEFLAPRSLPAIARRAGFSQVAVDEDPVRTHHDDLKSLMLSVKAIGANQHGGTRRRGLMPPSALARAATAYEGMRQSEGLPLTYHLVYLMGRKA